MDSTGVKKISECFIKPKHFVPESNVPYNLTPCDLSMLSFNYIQKGLLFATPSHNDDKQYSIDKLVDSLKESLSITLVHFYPLAGQLAIQIDKDKQKCIVFVDCNKGPGAKFIQATLDMTISDIISPVYVPKVVHSFFDPDGAVNFDGQTRSLLSVQVTELLDGVFIGCSLNHAMVDGTAYWQFWNTWSKIHRENGDQNLGPCPRLPTGGHSPGTSLPFTSLDEIVSRYEPPQLREKFFHFSPQVIARLKEKANNESKIDIISSFQALTAFVWKSVVKAASRPDNEVTDCKLAIGNRHRLQPPLPQMYFGNCVNVISTSTTVSEILERDLGWIASLLHELVASYSDTNIRDQLNNWLLSPVFFTLHMLDSLGITMSSSPRFDIYGNEFGLGKAVAVRSGSSNKFARGVTAYQGREGGGSVELEICLPPDSMNALELDEEFMAAISLRHTGE